MLQKQYEDLKKSVDCLTVSSVDALLHKIQTTSSRPLPEFNKFETLELVDALHKAAHDIKHEKEQYYQLAYETLRTKLSHSPAIFRSYVLPLFGNKDQMKILDIISNVDKSHSRRALVTSASPFQPYPFRGRCFGCNRVGHVRANCPTRLNRRSRGRSFQSPVPKHQ